MSVNQNILDAIQVLINNSIQKAGYDKTIQAQVISCEDATIGKYKCRYQDAIIYAYASNADVSYSKGAYVYILVPGNDMQKDKTILGTTEKLGINYISQAEGDQAYNIIGTNGIISNDIYYLDTENQNYNYTLYSYDNQQNDITLDINALNEYIKKSSSLIAGASFKTSIPIYRQQRGHYGIIFNLRFYDNTSGQDTETGKQIIRSYIINEDNMIDNPYKLNYKTRQYQIFDIDGQNFIRVQSIYIFNNGFPGAAGSAEGKLITGDIEISNLELYGAERLSNEEINGVAITFYTPQGVFFKPDASPNEQKTITAQVKIKGKLVSSSQNLSFYWGSENVGIKPDSQYYNSYLGRGWKCLNEYNVIESDDSNGDIIEWVPGSDTIVLKCQDATAKINTFKVAVIYDGNVITKQISIQNKSINVPNIKIESDGGTDFYYDIGHPTLTCKVNNQQYNNYTYYWAYITNTGVLYDLPETTDKNVEYSNLVIELEAIQSGIASGVLFPNALADRRNELKAAIAAYDFIERIENNKIYNVQINNITNFGTFKCSVYNGNTYLGTASIVLKNSLQTEGTYSLVINNGDAVFQYDENGVAPNNKSLITPQQIQALSFTVYDNLGRPIDENIIHNTNNCYVRWEFPIQDSLLVDVNDMESAAGTDQTGTYQYYENVATLMYNIAQRYDIRKVKNQIKLTVKYKDINLTTQTKFTFAKQGEPGTNGTQFVVKLIPNTTMVNPPLWPMITNVNGTYKINYGIGSPANETEIGTNTSYKFFNAQLWGGGQLIWEGSQAPPQPDNITDITWSILANIYNAKSTLAEPIVDESNFEIIDASTGLIKYLGDDLSSIDTPYANIIKCSITYNNKIYTGTIPITTAWVSDETFKVYLKDYTGFRYVLYTSDGISPQYDNSHPFEFICEEQINNIWEDVSLVPGDYAITYQFNSCGNTKSLIPNQPIDATVYLTKTIHMGLNDNQQKFIPISSYNGERVNEAVTCIYKRNNIAIARIKVPIHFLLNKYGLSHLNSWDGNSIQINDEGGYILSPQMGAGKKNPDNSFTGVLMGEVKIAGKRNSDTGILGYADGDRTFFLNSENGSAIFGKQGNGQIIIDPDADRALLYSNSFWKNYTEAGLPVNYTNLNESDQGLLIDLTTPEIRFGNGNFKVDNDGVYIKGKFVLQNGTPVEDIADDAIVSDTLHYLATSYGSGVTKENGNWGIWTTSPQTLTTVNKYLWIYHTQVKGNGDVINTDPVINGVYGDAGPQGPSGESPLRIDIESDVGNIFLRTYTEAVLTCHVWKGDQEITNQVSQFNWIKKNKDGIVDANWSRPSQQSINIDSNDIKTKAIFICEVEF